MARVLARRGHGALWRFERVDVARWWRRSHPFHGTGHRIATHVRADGTNETVVLEEECLAEGGD